MVQRADGGHRLRLDSWSNEPTAVIAYGLDNGVQGVMHVQAGGSSTHEAPSGLPEGAKSPPLDETK